MTTVLVVDDQAMVREGFSALLAAQDGIEVVGAAADGVTAVTQAAALRPDVVLMDIRMPRMDGIEATRRIVEQSPPGSVHVLVLTTFDLDDYVVEALRAGASGFLLKDADAQQLTEAVRVVARGDALLAPAVTKRLIATYLETSQTPVPRSAELEQQLTPRELEVLSLIAEGLTNQEIAGRLYLAEPTVKSHVSHVLAKCGLRDRAQAVILAYESGLVRPGG
ncbi:MAG: response regulator transcription factor [Cellulomonas sp.]|uniref:response regulator n=1 Tax=Cellulomonas sp. TaxID=40001 RepID=UPI001A0362FB|nr:response regulator transcription factor [Cellulomonas sp.]MBF0689429.1 response regulator transcription factor [Cellulomonas sp.]